MDSSMLQVKDAGGMNLPSLSRQMLQMGNWG